MRTHGTTVKYSAHIIISIYSNCTKDKGSLITAYVHFLSKTTELKKCRDLESLAGSRNTPVYCKNGVIVFECPDVL